MKILITENQLDRVAYNYISHQLGGYKEIIPIPRPSLYDGGIITNYWKKNGKVIAAIDTGKEFYVHTDVYTSFDDMFPLDENRKDKIFRKWVFDNWKIRVHSTWPERFELTLILN